ncbi:MAG: hypothetical protein DRP01_10615 [Archaeoglobales archaeon]|nr:MAG: hypothetical protein DRP01_10615 [Archaeoglobales archaeon]
MKIERDEAMEALMIKSLRRERREGDEIHFSSLNFCLRKEFIRRKYQIEPEPEIALMWTAGALFHDAFKLPRKEELYRRDGIYCRPDAIYEVDGKEYPVEIKTTRAKMRERADQRHYIRQLMAYCRVLEVNIGYLAVVYMMGDYRERVPKLVVNRMEFEPGEIEENWKWLVERKDLLKWCLENGVPPPRDTRAEEWECNHCDCKRICEVLED